MNKKIAAIHQPNFFPWLGYFEKIAQSDFFVFLDDVQFTKTGGSWSNRVKLLISGIPNWVTATIDRNYSGTRNINEMNFINISPLWQEKMIKSIENNYKKHPFYSEVMPQLVPLILNKETNIAEYNITAIIEIANWLGINISKFRRSSTILTNSQSNEMLCELTAAFGANSYMCGGGADGYQDAEVFKKQGIHLLYQNFQHPIYPQKGQAEFVPGLSIIDALMNIGKESVADLLAIKVH